MTDKKFDNCSELVVKLSDMLDGESIENCCLVLEAMIVELYLKLPKEARHLRCTNLIKFTQKHVLGNKPRGN